MSELIHKLYIEEYQKAGVYGKIITIPELVEIVVKGEGGNKIIQKILNYFKLSKNELKHIERMGGKYIEPVLGHIEKYPIVKCSDGKEREYEYNPIPPPCVVGFTDVQLFRIDKTGDNKCWPTYHYINYAYMEDILLSKEERSRIVSIRSTLAKEKILGLFKKGFDVINLQLIQENTGLDPYRYDSVLRTLVEEGILKKIDGSYELIKKK